MLYITFTLTVIITPLGYPQGIVAQIPHAHFNLSYMHLIFILYKLYNVMLTYNKDVLILFQSCRFLSAAGHPIVDRSGPA